jgi:hypothetical protein
VWSSAWSLSFSDSPWCVWSGSDADRCFAHPALSPWGLRPLQDTSSYGYGLRLRMAMRAWLLCSGRDTIRSPMEWWTTAGLLVVLQDCCGVWLFVALARRIVFIWFYLQYYMLCQESRREIRSSSIGGRRLLSKVKSCWTRSSKEKRWTPIVVKKKNRWTPIQPPENESWQAKLVCPFQVSLT